MEKNIIILHGWASKLERWDQLRKGLEQKGWQVFLPSLPGFGKNSLIKPWGLDDYLFWLQDWIRNKNLDDFFLLGHSFGGSIAIKYAAQRPKQLRGLILVNSAGVRKRLTLKKLIFLPIAKIGKLVFFIPPLCFFKKPAVWLFYTFIREKDYYQANPVMKKTLKIIFKEDLRKISKRVKVPSLILWGEKDKLTPLVHGRLFNQKIAKSKLIVYDNVGHNLPFVKTRELIEEIKNFCFQL